MALAMANSRTEREEGETTVLGKFWGLSLCHIEHIWMAAKKTQPKDQSQDFNKEKRQKVKR